jgi:hypothetical protein
VIFGSTDVRLFKGFSFNIFAKYVQTSTNQIAGLPKQGATEQEILLTPAAAPLSRPATATSGSASRVSNHASCRSSTASVQRPRVQHVLSKHLLISGNHKQHRNLHTPNIETPRTSP